MTIFFAITLAENRSRPSPKPDAGAKRPRVRASRLLKTRSTPLPKHPIAPSNTDRASQTLDQPLT
ncbi:hypothetical protein [Dactylococcopsis salina]|uniref:hypothetical protein n=1 Tax=Dactylococcopsis salina TaxID=292566 RepID=UPI0002EC3DE0|nr:hypothetical protein [Dactylococcopsis salina]